MSGDNKNKLISLSEAAKLTPYSGAYLNVLIKRGKLKGQKVGRNWCTTREWVKEYLVNSLVKSPAENMSENEEKSEKQWEEPERKENAAAAPENAKSGDAREFQKLLKGTREEIGEVKTNLEELKKDHYSLETELERIIVSLDNNYRQKLNELKGEMEELRQSQKKIEKDFYSEIKL